MKKLMSLILCSILLVSCMAMASAGETAEKKTYIVELEAPAVYSPDRVTLFSADDTAYREELLALQAEVRSQINGGVSLFSLRNTDDTYTYTDILNGFTVNTDPATAEKIKEIDGVKGVYEDEIVEMSQPVSTEDADIYMSEDSTADGDDSELSWANSANMINVKSAYDKGYKGQGRAIAVIDGTITPNHEYYKLSDEASAKYTQEDIAQILQNNTMNVSATAAAAYRNSKIPFAYNYAQKSPVVTGKDLHGKYRETAKGGLAELYGKHLS